MKGKRNIISIAMLRSRCDIVPGPLRTKCWVWKSKALSGGNTRRDKVGKYAYIRVNGKAYSVHRLMFALTRGPIPPDHDIDHECEIKPCCNPAHLVARTRGDHNRRHGQGPRYWKEVHDGR